MSARQLQVKKNTEQEIRAEELQLLFKLFGANPLTNEVYLKLNTSEDPGRSEIFLLPGREGCGCIFQDLAKYLKVPAVSIQYDNSDPEKNLSIEQITNDIFPHFLERNKNRRDFFIVAYSFGTLVAIELVRKLEAEGFTGKLILIDCSPEFSRVFVEERITSTNQHEHDISLLMYIAYGHFPCVIPKLSVAIKGCKSWDEKLDTFLKYTSPNTCGLTPEGLRTLLNVMCNRSIAVEVYIKATFPPINTPILLLKAAYRTLTKSVGEDYGLSNVTKAQVDVREIKDSHGTIYLNPEVASIINAEWELLYNESV